MIGCIKKSNCVLGLVSHIRIKVFEVLEEKVAE